MREHPRERSMTLLQACDEASRYEAELSRRKDRRIAELEAQVERLSRELDYADARLQQWGVR